MDYFVDLVKAFWIRPIMINTTPTRAIRRESSRNRPPTPMSMKAMLTKNPMANVMRPARRSDFLGVGFGISGCL